MHAASVRDRWKVKTEYKMDENKLFQLFKLILRKIVLENVKITPKTIITFLDICISFF